MVHPLVEQLRFARSEFERGIAGVSEDDAQQRLGPMNCISWNVGHMAWREQRCWLFLAQDRLPMPEINERFAFGSPASTPLLESTLKDWRALSEQADAWLDTITPETLSRTITANGRPTDITFGSLLLRNIYHYWYHTGENAAIRQQLGHGTLPDFVGDIDHEAPYRPT